MNKTLDYYAHNTQAFIEQTVKADMSATRSKVLQGLSQGASILDLGCGSGRDSLAFKKLGYQVTATDGSPELAEYASKLLEQQVICKTFDSLKFPAASFNLIWACASLLHMPFKDLPGFLEWSCKWLKPNGKYYMSFKYGDYEGMRDGKYYTDLTEERLAQVMLEVKVLHVDKTWVSKDVRKDNDTQWFNVILSNVES